MKSASKFLGIDPSNLAPIIAEMRAAGVVRPLDQAAISAQIAALTAAEPNGGTFDPECDSRQCCDEFPDKPGFVSRRTPPYVHVPRTPPKHEHLDIDAMHSRQSSTPTRSPSPPPPSASWTACPRRRPSPKASPSVCTVLKGVKAAVFMHSNPRTDEATWRAIFDDQVKTLRRSMLAACGVVTYVGLPDKTPWPIADACGSASFLRPYTPSPRQWSWGDTWEEEKTLAALYEYCKSPARSDSDLVAYTHDKGTRIPRSKDQNRFDHQWDWRKLHEYFILERPEGCIAALASGSASLCGSELSHLYGRHFSGNFWWATCRHVRSLQVRHGAGGSRVRGGGQPAPHPPFVASDGMPGQLL